MRREPNWSGRTPKWVLVAALGVMVCAACEHRPTRVEYLDLVTSRSLHANGEPLQAAETFAADETWTAVALESGMAVTADLALRSDPTLTLAGCLVCADGRQAEDGATFAGTIDAGDGLRVNFSIDLDPDGG